MRESEGEGEGEGEGKGEGESETGIGMMVKETREGWWARTTPRLWSLSVATAPITDHRSVVRGGSSFVRMARLSNASRR